MRKNLKTIIGNLKRRNECGSSLVITLLVMTLMLGFIAVALSRTASESRVAFNDAAESRTLAASEAGLEDATRDFATVLENKLNPTTKDLERIRDSEVEGFADKYDIGKTLSPVGNSELIVIQSGAFQGLYSLRDEWQINVKAREINSDVKVETMRRFYNNRIPIFQFGAFYQDDLELNRPPLFTFSGKVHTNSNIFISSFPLKNSGGVFFKSKVTAAGEIVNDIWKTGTQFAAGTDDSGDVYFPNASGTDQRLTVGNGSVKCTSGTGGILKEIGGRGRPFPYPNCTKNTGWTSFSQRFEGNLKANTPELRLPVDRINVPLIEIVRRGKNVGDKIGTGSGFTASVTEATKDNGTVSKERYSNKQGIRISLADSKDKLPGCASAGTSVCGVRLDGSSGSSLGYEPKQMTDGYKATILNGNRLAISGRQVWIKVEMVDFDYDAEVPLAKDITEDFLSLGVTEPFYTEAGGSNPTASPRLALANYANTRDGSGRYTGQDSRSVIKIQRFYMEEQSLPSSPNYITNRTVGSTKYNYSARTTITVPGSGSARTNCLTSLASNGTSSCTVNGRNNFAAPVGSSLVNSNESAHYRVMTVPSDSSAIHQIVPFPIQMYDSREGNRADSGSGVSSGNVYRNGVMSLIDIDVANLRRFFNGEFDGKFPTTTPYAASNDGKGLKSTDIPDNRGWVIYVSDRRGDHDFDGRFTMEDVNPNTSALVSEDLDNNGVIDTGGYSTGEAPTVNQQVESGLAAVTDHVYYRRGVRLINAVTLPGRYDSATPSNTKGVTFASENGIYVAGNYNTTGVSLPGGTAPAESTAYAPQNTSLHIPSSIVGDAVTILSNNWNDANSFINAFDTTKRVASSTQVRFAMISGDSLTARTASSTKGDFDGLNGGLHNFKRFLETWDGKRLNYSGSLINLYNSFNNNGKWKCCTTVYDPPIRDWTFDNTFSDPNRLPPGAPFVYYLSFTGFQRVNQ